MVRRNFAVLWAISMFVLISNLPTLTLAANFAEYGDWQEIKPGGRTTCARGTEFSFFYRPAISNRVVIDFMGGGACWNDSTCNHRTATFTDSVEYVREYYRKGLEGIYDHRQSDNPVKDWHHIVIPYCTGDLHWGNNDSVYNDPLAEPFTIHHRGAENVEAVLAWVAEKFAGPQRILVTGCSAGAYGAIYWTPKIKEMYRESQIMQLGDSGAGVLTPSFPQQAFPLWKPELHGPTWIPGLDPANTPWADLSLEVFYEHVAEYYPELQFSQFNLAFDGTQTFFYELMGGLAWDWRPKMIDSNLSIAFSTPNFHTYIAPGTDHCILPYQRFYSTKSKGVKFRSWFKRLVDGKDLDSVICKDCLFPES